MKRPTRAQTAGLLLVGALCLPLARAWAAENLDELAQRLIQLRGEVEDLHRDIEAKQESHRSRMSSLAQQRAELEAQLQRQDLELQKLRRSIAEQRRQSTEAERAAASFAPAARDVAESLEARVDQGLPFKVEERKREVADVISKLDKGELSAPRALNQLWSFVEDELRLTRENGLFRQVIVINGQEQLADVIRLGMVMLVFRTSDGLYGYADRSGDGWTYEQVDQEAAKKLQKLFEAFDKQVRTGFFEMPNALPEEAP